MTVFINCRCQRSVYIDICHKLWPIINLELQIKATYGFVTNNCQHFAKEMFMKLCIDDPPLFPIKV